MSTNEALLAYDILGTTGLKQTGGWVVEEFLRQLRGPRATELIKEMTWNSAQVGAVRNLIHTLARQVEWNVEAAKEPTDPQQATFAEKLLRTSKDDMEHSWHTFITEALSHYDYGYSYHEIVYKLRRGPKGLPITRSKYDDGAIGWRRIELRSQDSLDRWQFSEEHELEGFWQRDPYANSYSFIPSNRAIHFRTETFKNNPEGRSGFRNAVVSYLRLKHIEDIEAIGVERDLAGMPFLQVPPEILAPGNNAEYRALRTALETQLGQIKRDQRDFILMPAEVNKDGKNTGFKFQLLASSGTRQLDIVAIKNSYKTDILMTVLAQFLQLGVNSVTGSRSLASSATDLFTLSEGALLDNMQETINTQLVDPLMELNGVAAENRPRIIHGDIETPDLGPLGTFLQQMFTTGTLEPSEKLMEALHHAAGLPYEPQRPAAAIAPGGVKTAQQLIDEVMGGKQPGGVAGGASASTPPAAGAQPQGAPVKTADELISRTRAEVRGVKPAEDLMREAKLNANGVKSADQLIEEARSSGADTDE